MIGLGSSALKVFVAVEPLEMRKGFNGLVEVAAGQSGERLARDALFVFTNKRRTRIKLLCFDGTGLWLATKRLERGVFSWPQPREPGQRKPRLQPEALPEAPETVLPVLLLIQRIYFIEKQMRYGSAPPACRGLIRRARTRPLADELHALLVAHRSLHLPHGGVGEAVTYALNQWDKFLVCLDDGNLEVDNNLLENRIRPDKLCAKNWLFLGNAEAGETAGLFYTLLANCHSHGLDPEFYLAEVIRRLPHNATV